MQVTGYRFKEAIKMAGLELDAVRSTFDESLFVFAGDEREDPVAIAKTIEQLESQVAMLQTAQAEYNLAVAVSVKDTDGNKIDMSLGAAIRLVGGMGRLAKMWRTAARGKIRDRWDRQRVETRSKDLDVAQPTVPKRDALNLAKQYERFASALMNAIAVGNTTKLDIAGVDASLLA